MEWQLEISENDFGLSTILKTEETHRNTSTFEFSPAAISWHAQHVLVKTNHLPGPECAMLSCASNFPEMVYPIHLPNLSCELLLILQIAHLPCSPPPAPRSLLSQRKVSTLSLWSKCHSTQHYASWFSVCTTLSPPDRKLSKGTNYAVLRWHLPGSW